MENVEKERSISVLSREGKSYSPTAAFAKAASVSGKSARAKLSAAAAKAPEKFWDAAAKELHWFKPWRKTLDWKVPHAKWFVGATTNLSYNCLDRHLDGPRRNKAALIWESEPGQVRTYTYLQLHREVSLFANALKGLGVKKDDRVAIYLPPRPFSALAKRETSRWS